MGSERGENSVPPVPPIVTLPRGFECAVGQLNYALSSWPGIHMDCGLFVWTSRQVAVVLRIPDPEARALVVTLAGLPYIDRQAVFLSLDFAPPVETTLIAGQAKRVTVPITARRDPAGGLMTLMICVPAAASHLTFDPASNGHSRPGGGFARPAGDLIAGLTRALAGKQAHGPNSGRGSEPADNEPNQQL